MRRWWSADELVERWSLTPEDLSLLVGRIDAGSSDLPLSSHTGGVTAPSPTRRPTSHRQ